MTVEQRDKYAYELMVKNNPEEAVKQLLLKDKEINRLKEENTKSNNDIKLLLKENENKEKIIKKQEEILHKAIKLLEEDRYSASFNITEQLVIKLLKGEDNE